MSKAPQRLLKNEDAQQSTPQPKPKKEAAQFDLASYSLALSELCVGLAAIGGHSGVPLRGEAMR